MELYNSTTIHRYFGTVAPLNNGRAKRKPQHYSLLITCGLVPSITTTVRKKGPLSTSSWRPAHALDSFVVLPSAKRFPAKN